MNNERKAQLCVEQRFARAVASEEWPSIHPFDRFLEVSMAVRLPRGSFVAKRTIAMSKEALMCGAAGNSLIGFLRRNRRAIQAFASRAHQIYREEFFVFRLYVCDHAEAISRASRRGQLPAKSDVEILKLSRQMVDALYRAAEESLDRGSSVAKQLEAYAIQLRRGDVSLAREAARELCARAKHALDYSAVILGTPPSGCDLVNQEAIHRIVSLAQKMGSSNEAIIAEMADCADGKVVWQKLSPGAQRAIIDISATTRVPFSGWVLWDLEAELKVVERARLSVQRGRGKLLDRQRAIRLLAAHRKQLTGSVGASKGGRRKKGGGRKGVDGVSGSLVDRMREIEVFFKFELGDHPSYEAVARALWDPHDDPLLESVAG